MWKALQQILGGLLSDTQTGTANLLQGPLPADPVSRKKLLSSLDRRFAIATLGAVPGHATDASLERLVAFNSRYRELLAAGVPSEVAGQVREQVANSQEWIARACAALARNDQALLAFTTASEDWLAAGKHIEAQRCQTELARLRAAVSGNIDAEIVLLGTVLDSARPRTLAHAAATVELAEATARGGDSYRAQQLLADALAELNALEIPAGPIRALPSLDGVHRDTLLLRAHFTLGQILQVDSPADAMEHVKAAEEIRKRLDALSGVIQKVSRPFA